MYKIIFLFIFGFFVSSFAQNYEYARQFGGNNDEEGNSLQVDASGNIYFTGIFRDTVDFDPGPGVFTLMNKGNNNISSFVCKLDPNGDFLWAKKIGDSIYSNSPPTLALDSFNNSYIAGTFTDEVDFDSVPGTFNLTAFGSVDAFVCKLDPNGNFLWVKQLGGTGAENPRFINVGISGNVYITGKFSDTGDYDPGTGVFELFPVGMADIFINKLDPNGNFVWAKSFGGVSNEECFSITTDVFENVYTTGQFGSTVDFDPGTGTFNMTASGATDVFIQKLDKDGNFIWAQQLGGGTSEIARSIAISNTGNVYSVGYFLGTVDFDPGPGIYNLTSVASYDIYVSKLDQDGNFVWAKQLGGNSLDFARSIAIDDCENLYITGIFLGTADFDPGPGAYNFTSKGGNDSYIVKLDSAGNFVWAEQLGGTSNENSLSVFVDNRKNVYTTGSFRDTIDFDPGMGTDTFISKGKTDIFVHKLSQCTNNFSTDFITACNSYTWINGNTYTSSNNTATYTYFAYDTNCCDSIITLNLTINTTVEDTQILSYCDSAFINGVWYLSNQLLTSDTMINGSISGCDSISHTMVEIIQTPQVVINPISDSIYQGENIVLSAGGAQAYVWENNDTNQNRTVMPTTTDTFCVIGSNLSSYGMCSDSNCTMIFVTECDETKDIFLPTALSVNGDNRNNQLCMSGNTDCIQAIKLNIYTRFGERVYETMDINSCWDGSYEGKVLSTGMYLYSLEVMLINEIKRNRKGNILLIY